MLLKDIKPPAYVNLRVPGVVGFMFYSNLKWDGHTLEKPAHDFMVQRWGWVSADVHAAEVMMDTWEVQETGDLPFDHPYGNPKPKRAVVPK